MTPKPTNPQDKDKAISDIIYRVIFRIRSGEQEVDGSFLPDEVKEQAVQEALQALTQLLAQPSVVLPEKVDRFEVIDNEGRAYAKGSIYGSPVKVKLSLQDEGRTLKVFVKGLNNKEEK